MQVFSVYLTYINLVVCVLAHVLRGRERKERERREREWVSEWERHRKCVYVNSSRKKLHEFKERKTCDTKNEEMISIFLNDDNLFIWSAISSYCVCHTDFQVRKLFLSHFWPLLKWASFVEPKTLPSWASWIKVRLPNPRSTFYA